MLITWDTATSVDAERAFSRGRLMVNRLRTSLSDRSVRAGTVLGSWACIDGLLVEADIIAFLADKKGARARARARARASSQSSAQASESEPEDEDEGEIRLEGEDELDETGTGTSGAEDPVFSDDDLYA